MCYNILFQNEMKINISVMPSILVSNVETGEKTTVKVCHHTSVK